MTSSGTVAPDVAALAAPYTLPNGATLTNRLVKSALSEGLGSIANAPTDRLIRLYERWATSGASLIITGNVMIDRRAVGEPGNVVIEDDRDLERLAEWAKVSTSGGAQAWVQINHPGRQTLRTISARPVAPSAVGVKGMLGAFAVPRALTSAEIHDLIARWALAAKVSVDAGFDGVQVHGAHGYLVSQFLSPLTNLRTDEWGGTPEKRRRFLLEVVRAIRAEIGASAPLSVKLNSADFQRGGFTEDESLDVVLALAEEGIDLLEISGGTYESSAMLTGTEPAPTKASTRAREAYFLAYAEKVRAATPLPLMLTGGFRSATGMVEAIDGGAVDLVGLGRPLALTPEFPAQLLAGETTLSTVQPRRLGVQRLDGAVELTWYNMQMHRLADGKEPAPDLHPALSVGHTIKSFSTDAVRRLRTR